MEAQRDVTYEEAKQFAEENGGFKTFNGFFGVTHRKGGILILQII